MIAAYHTVIGWDRPRNQDYIWLDTRTGVFVVADGVGGRAAGDIASRLAATFVGRSISAWLRLGTDSLTLGTMRALLVGTLEAASREVRAAGTGQQQGMGATMVVAVVRSSVAYICHAGDARAYLVRATQLHRLTEDHTLIARMIAAGTVTECAARTHPQSHLITKMVGQDEPLRPTFAAITMAAGDQLLLCSDGLWSPLDDEAILTTLQHSAPDPALAVAALVSAAQEAGGADDISAVVVRVGSR